MRIPSLMVLAALASAPMASCDKSPQSADGATEPGDLGNAGATPSGAVADTGRDNAGADVGGAGQIAEPGGATDAGDATSPKSQ